MKPIPATACIGFRPRIAAGGAARRRTLDLVVDSLLREFEDYVITPDSGEIVKESQPFNRSAAKNRAATLALGAPSEVLFFLDADSYVPPEMARLAVQGVLENGADICFAHNGTATYLHSGTTRGHGKGGLPGPFPGGAFAISTKAFTAMGGFDEKFVGWGHEDVVFFWCAQAIFGLNIQGIDHGPMYKLDMLFPRHREEYDLAEGSGPEAELYQRNTRRRDAYFALPAGAKAAYWELRNTETE